MEPPKAPMGLFRAELKPKPFYDQPYWKKRIGATKIYAIAFGISKICLQYTLWWTNIAIENGPVEIVDFPMKNGGSFHGKMLVYQAGYPKSEQLYPNISFLKRWDQQKKNHDSQQTCQLSHDPTWTNSVQRNTILLEKNTAVGALDEFNWNIISRHI